MLLSSWFVARHRKSFGYLEAPIRFPEFEMTQYRGGNIAPYRRRRSLLTLSNNAAEGDGFNRS